MLEQKSFLARCFEPNLLMGHKAQWVQDTREICKIVAITHRAAQYATSLLLAKHLSPPYLFRNKVNAEFVWN